MLNDPIIILIKSICKKTILGELLWTRVPIVAPRPQFMERVYMADTSTLPLLAFNNTYEQVTVLAIYNKPVFNITKTITSILVSFSEKKDPKKSGYQYVLNFKNENIDQSLQDLSTDNTTKTVLVLCKLMTIYLTKHFDDNKV
jgi:hypothetical protein